jgi:hypothetical protein
MEKNGPRPAVERVRPPRALLRLTNPVVRALLASPLHGLLSGNLMVLRYTGRRTGRRVALPITRRQIDGRLAVVSSSRWRHNFSSGRDAELLVDGEWRATRGTLIADVDRVADAYDGQVAELGWKKAARRLGLRINVDRAPTHAELVAAIRTSGLSLVVFDPALPAATQREQA